MKTVTENEVTQLRRILVTEILDNIWNAVLREQESLLDYDTRHAAEAARCAVVQHGNNARAYESWRKHSSTAAYEELINTTSLIWLFRAYKRQK